MAAASTRRRRRSCSRRRNPRPAPRRRRPRRMHRCPRPSAPAARRAAPRCLPLRARRSRPAARRIRITTDLYTAEVDTVGGVITLVSLSKHHDATDPTKPYNALQRTAERTFIAQAGLIGEGLPNHRTLWRGGARAARPGRRQRSRRAAPHRRHARRRQGHAGPDVPPRQLPHRRRVRRRQQRRAAALAVRVFPAHARHQVRGRAELDGARVLRRARSSTTPTITSRRSISARSTRKPPTPAASRPTPGAPTTAGSG